MNSISGYINEFFFVLPESMKPFSTILDIESGKSLIFSENKEVVLYLIFPSTYNPVESRSKELYKVILLLYASNPFSDISMVKPKELSGIVISFASNGLIILFE